MVETKIGVLAYFVEVGVIRCVHLYVFVCGCALAVANTGRCASFMWGRTTTVAD